MTRLTPPADTTRQARAGDTAEPTTDRVPWTALSATARLTLRAIVEWDPDLPDGTRLIGRGDLAEFLGCGEATVTRATRALAAGGWLTKVAPPRALIDGQWRNLGVQGYLPDPGGVADLRPAGRAR